MKCEYCSKRIWPWRESVPVSTLEEDTPFGHYIRDHVICALKRWRRAVRSQHQYRKQENVELKNMTCPQCGKDFALVWNDYTTINGEAQPESLIMRGCPSGGIYDVSIRCPHCNYEEEL